MMANGKVTSDPDEYVKSWSDLANAVETLMPSWRVISYDPGLTFSVGQYGSASIPKELAFSIRDLLAENARLRPPTETPEEGQ